MEYRPSLRRYYPDQVQRVAVYSALNRPLQTRLPGDGQDVAGRRVAVHALARGRGAMHRYKRAERRRRFWRIGGVGLGME